MCRLFAACMILLLGAVMLPQLASSDELSGEIKTWTKMGMLAGATSTEKNACNDMSRTH